ncbi:PREDICTED: odorant receptor Or2-like [Ceratosolen solmsi marchali]|uniref:Odorant receptor n=1 Tax=Ceratosolen solmsi marchali TaxID=326594 RepID=A0AAJ6YPH1_9HYME|nr:PREDICTED: odorant receptor Or2-like [Ceratosolen solmsi marchali]
MNKNKIWTYEEISRPHIRLFQLVGFIPFEGKTLEFIGTKLLNVFWSLMVLSYKSMFVGYGIQMLRRKRRKFVELIKMCKQLWTYLTPDETTIIRRYERKAYYIWNIMMINVFSAVTIYILTAHFISIPSETMNGTQLKTLPFRFFADIQEDPLFTIVYVYQGIVTYSIVVINTAAEATGYYVILLACGYLRSVRTRLRSLAERQDKLNSNDKENQNKTTELIYKDVLQCAKFHQNIMVYCEEIEQFMRNISFVGVFTTIYNISMIGIKMFQHDGQFLKYMIIMIMNVFQFFTYQWSPDGLLRESDAIANAAYSTSLKQVGNHKSINKILHFLIMRAQKPMQLTAGGFVKLSMETFGVMIKSAFSFFALLRNADI